MAVEVPGTLIGSGRSADVFDIGNGRVLRRHRDGPGPLLKALPTRGVQTWFARAFVRAAGPLDERARTAAILERLADPNLLPSEVTRLQKLAPTPWPPDMPDMKA